MSQRNLRESSGEFAFAQFQRTGVRPLAEKIHEGLPLAEDDAFRLGSLPLPLLLSLVALQQERLEPPRLRTVACLPLAKQLEQYGTHEAFRIGTAVLDALDRPETAVDCLYLTVDRWTGTFSPTTLIDILVRLTARPFRYLNVALLGPSTAEVKSFYTEKKAGDQGIHPAAFLARLKAAGIAGLEGGSDLEIHSLALEQHLQVNVALKVATHAKDQDATQRFATFVTSLFAIRDILGAHPDCRSIFLLTSSVLDSPSKSGTEPLAAEVLSLLAVARLTVPNIPYVGAPYCLLGAATSALARSFGANDFGFCAVDSQTAALLGIPRNHEMQLNTWAASRNTTTPSAERRGNES